MSPPAPYKGSERFAACHARVEAGCGGHHENAPTLWQGAVLSRWICCADCPVRSEVASAIREDAVSRETSPPAEA